MSEVNGCYVAFSDPSMTGAAKTGHPDRGEVLEAPIAPPEPSTCGALTVSKVPKTLQLTGRSPIKKSPRAPAPGLQVPLRSKKIGAGSAPN